MRVIGLKLTHDAGFAVIEDGHIEYASEVEKFGDRPRYSKMPYASFVREHITIGKNSIVCIDGWKKSTELNDWGQIFNRYHEHDNWNEPISLGNISLVRGKFLGRDTISTQHVTNHITAAYMCSPFAGRDCCVLVMDGGMNPRLYKVNGGEDYEEPFIQYLLSASQIYGVIYSIMGYYFGPYANDERVKDVGHLYTKGYLGNYDWPGKLMAWIGNGTPDQSALDILKVTYSKFKKPKLDLSYNRDGVLEHELCRSLLPLDLPDEDKAASLHHFILQSLLNCARTVKEGMDLPLIFTGGSALNIKWNSQIRKVMGNDCFWVPPFPNDSGNAIGAAATAYYIKTGEKQLTWSVYCGSEADDDGKWKGEKMSPFELGRFLASVPEVVIRLDGRSEIGPRALGNRSLLASPFIKGIKDRLNNIKGREAFRPVAPIMDEETCLTYFNPGVPDPYMLFDHFIKPHHLNRFTEILHVDSSARVQTVTAKQNEAMYSTLKGFKSETGIAMLCNTSANRNGAGFFCSRYSAERWAELVDIKYIYMNERLYRRY